MTGERGRRLGRKRAIGSDEFLEREPRCAKDRSVFVVAEEPLGIACGHPDKAPVATRPEIIPTLLVTDEQDIRLAAASADQLECPCLHRCPLSDEQRGRCIDSARETVAGGRIDIEQRWRQGDSNPRPRQCDCRALPAELCPHVRRRKVYRAGNPVVKQGCCSAELPSVLQVAPGQRSDE